MTRLIVSIVATIVFVGFAMANTHHVALSFVIGAPVEIRMIFLLLTTLVIGMTIPVGFQVIRRARQARRRQLAMQIRQAEELANSGSR